MVSVGVCICGIHGDCRAHGACGAAEAMPTARSGDCRHRLQFAAVYALQRYISASTGGGRFILPYMDDCSRERLPRSLQLRGVGVSRRVKSPCRLRAKAEHGCRIRRVLAPRQRVGAISTDTLYDCCLQGQVAG